MPAHEQKPIFGRQAALLNRTPAPVAAGAHRRAPRGAVGAGDPSGGRSGRGGVAAADLQVGL